MNAAPSRLSVADRLFVALQYFLPQMALTGLIRWLSGQRSEWLKNALIRGFIRAYTVNVAEAASADVADYDCFNAFFTRALKPGARTVDAGDDAVVSPCDGRISAVGTLRDGQLLQAKGFRYRASELLGDDEMAHRFDGGRFITIYLAPYDYHRVHAPLGGSISRHRHLPGKLFSVNGATAAAVPRLFARNERRVFLLDGRAPAAMVMVGALNVGSISTVWSGTVIAGALSAPTEQPLPAQPLRRGDTIGWFNMGSTVILLLPPGAAFDPALAAGDVVRMGERIGNLSPSS